jgi:hypothetical protein
LGWLSATIIATWLLTSIVPATISHYTTPDADTSGLVNPCADSPRVVTRDGDESESIYRECLEAARAEGWDVEPFIINVDRRVSGDGLMLIAVGCVELFLLQLFVKEVRLIRSSRAS